MFFTLTFRYKRSTSPPKAEITNWTPLLPHPYRVNAPISAYLTWLIWNQGYPTEEGPNLRIITDDGVHEDPTRENITNGMEWVILNCTWVYRFSTNIPPFGMVGWISWVIWQLELFVNFFFTWEFWGNSNVRHPHLSFYCNEYTSNSLEQARTKVAEQYVESLKLMSWKLTGSIHDSI